MKRTLAAALVERTLAAALVAFGLAAAIVLFGCAGRPAPETTGASSPEASLQLRSFDQAWTRVGETYPYADMGGLDWQAVRDELRPKAARARSAAEVRPVIKDMLARLKQSHFQVIPGSAVPVTTRPREASDEGDVPERDAKEPPADIGDVGIEVRPLDDEIVVVRVDPGSPAADAGVAAGWTLLSVGRMDATKLLAGYRRDLADRREADLHAWLDATRTLQGAPGSTIEATFLHGGSGKATLQLVRRTSPGEVVQIGNLPPLVTRVEHETLDGGVAYLRFNIFLVPVAGPFRDAVKEIVATHARGVVLDLRGNPGGIGGMVMGLAGHFFGRTGVKLGTMTTREGRLTFVANPRGPSQLFEGPLAVLVDGMSVSTSELFAAGLQQNDHRARVFGERTAGMALPSVIETLPNGDRIQFALADLDGPDGKRLEGVGVEPDVVAPLTREALLEGRDPALDAAVEWILSQPEPTVPAVTPPEASAPAPAGT